MGGIKIIKPNQEVGAIALVLFLHLLNLLLGGDAQLFGCQHDGRAVGVVGAHVAAIVAAGFLKAHPDIGLHLFQQVSQVQGPVGIGQGAGYEDVAHRLVRHWYSSHRL